MPKVKSITDARRKTTATWAEDQLDPDNWIEIPEFGVMPADVDFEGFAYPIVHPQGKNPELAKSLRSLVQVARSLARARFKTLAELRAAYVRGGGMFPSEAIAFGEDERTALLYSIALFRMEWVLDPPEHMSWNDVLESVAGKAALIATWAYRGATTAAVEAHLEAQRIEASRNGVHGAHKRWGRDPITAAKHKVNAEWRVWWREQRHLYRTQAEFVRAMLEKHQDLRSFKVVDGWCSEWKKVTPENPV